MPIQKMMRGTILRKGKNDFYAPPAGQSYRWKHWVTEHDIKVCVACKTGAWKNLCYGRDRGMQRLRCISIAAAKYAR